MKGPDSMRHDRDRQGDDAEALGVTLVRARRGAAYLLIIAVMGAVAAMSWAGLYVFATHELGWSTWHAALVPVALDIAAMACALLALDSIGKGETAMGFRMLTAAFVALSAWVNWRTALRTGNIAQEVFFPAMSCLAYALVHEVMGKARREMRREQHGQKARQALEPLPRTGILAWLLFPLRTFGALRASVATRLPEVPAAEVMHRDISATVVLEGLTQADAIRRAIEAVGDQPRDVVAYLADNGWPGVAPQRIYDVLRRDRLRAIGSTGTQEAV